MKNRGYQRLSVAADGPRDRAGGPFRWDRGAAPAVTGSTRVALPRWRFSPLSWDFHFRDGRWACYKRVWSANFRCASPVTSKEIDVKRAATVVTALALTLTGCSTAASETSAGPDAGQAVSQEEFLATHGLAGMTAPEIIEHLDRMAVADRPTDLIASVLPDELLLTDDNQEVALDLPADLSYVSIAPYVTQTHDCFYHSLTTCLGELDNEPIQVTITDEATGEVLVEEDTITFDNGFVGFWLPEDATGTIDITHQDRTGTTGFATTEDGATCLTDLRLS